MLLDNCCLPQSCEHRATTRHCVSHVQQAIAIQMRIGDVILRLDLSQARIDLVEIFTTPSEARDSRDPQTLDRYFAQSRPS